MNVHERSGRTALVARTRRSIRRLCALAVAMLVAIPPLAVTTAATATAAADDGVLRILLFYKTNFHASHVQAREAVNALAQELATQYDQTLQVEETDDPAAFNAANLATHDAVVFAQTGGVLFNTEQREALEDYIRGGGGYMGLHYAAWSAGTVSEHDVNPFYLRLVGAVSEGHPENPAVRPGEIVVQDTGHPLTQGLPATHTRSDEWYDWNVNPAQHVRTLVTVTESSYQNLGRQGTTHPVTWCQEIDEGRSWYTSMGHEGAHYSESYMRTQMRHGLAFAAGLLAADCSPPAKDQAGEWGGVQPWPLMAINMSLTAEGKIQSFGSVDGWGSDSTPYDWTGNSSVSQGGQFETDVWDPAQERTLDNLRDGVVDNITYTDLFCSVQVQNPHRRTVMTMGGDDALGDNFPVNGAIGVTSYSSHTGLVDEAPMQFPRWYPTATTMPSGDIVVQGGDLRGNTGPGAPTPEIYTPNDGSGWTALTGATSTEAYNGGGENRWWYPRAFVAPGEGHLFNVSGTVMWDLDPYANDGTGELTMRGSIPAAVADQGGDLGRPVGATSTAVMYQPGKILQVGGGGWSNGGGGQGARGGMIIDITGGTENPQITATEPMTHHRHWANATVMPDGNVIVTGGSAGNNNNDRYVTNPEIWNPETGEWTYVEVPYEHARLYHSTALLVPDGRIMIAGGGAPGPRNYTDVEYYSPAYLFDGDEEAVRPEITGVPSELGYDGVFQVSTAGGPISRVTLVRNGSVTHSFNNDQNFQELEFTQSGGTLTVTAPQDATYAPPGAYMLFVFDAAGTPSVAEVVHFDPEVEMDQRTPEVVDQFEYPRVPTSWRSGTYPAVTSVEAGDGRMAPWTVTNGTAQLVRGESTSMGGLGLVGTHLAVAPDVSLERTLTALDPGREYRLSLRYARDSRTAGSADAVTELSVGDLQEQITATTATPSVSNNGHITFDTYVGTFTAGQRSETLTLEGAGAAGMVIDDLVVIGSGPGIGDPLVHYRLDEGAGSSSANSGSRASVGALTLHGDVGWSDDAVFGKALDLPGGEDDFVTLPDRLLQGVDDFSVSLWTKLEERDDWTGLFQVGQGTGGSGGYFQIQTSTQATPGGSGLAATFKNPGTLGGSVVEERVLGGASNDLPLGAWAHVAFTMEGTTGTLYLDGEPIASRDDFSIGLADVGDQTANWLGRNGYSDAPFNGKMDDVRVYGSALDASSVGRLHADGAALRTTTTVHVSPESPSPHGEPLTVSATVIGPGGEDAEGSVSLWVNGTSVGGAVELVAGAATFPALTRPRGDHTVEVRFDPAEGFRSSTGSVVHTVERPGTGQGAAVHFPFDEGAGTSAANVGWDVDHATATVGATWWSQGVYGPGVNLPGGASSTGNHVLLPDNLTQDYEDEFSVSIWANPRTLPTWVPLLQLGSSTDTFFLLQSSTQASGATGFAATFKQSGNPAQERLTLGAGNDLPLNEWTHVVFTMSGSTGKIYFDGELQATRDDFTLGIQDVGTNQQTTANMIGGTSWPDARWNGWVDDFQLFDHELSADDVRRLAAGPAAPSAPVTEFGHAAAIQHSGSASWEAPEKVSFPSVPTSSAPGAGHGWGTWGLANNGTSTARAAWIRYGWDTPVTLDSTDVYWLDDGAGSRVPRGDTWAIEYSDNGTSWTPVTLANGSTYAGALDLNTFNRVEFEEVTATFLRIRIWGVAGAGAGTGVLRWAANGPGIASVDDRLLVRTTVGTVPNLPAALDAVREDGTESFLEVGWQPITAGMVAAVNDAPFVVYGSNAAHKRVAEARVYVRTNPEGGISIDEVESFDLRVEPGELPTLPRVAEVLYSDGSRDNRTIGVDWDLDESVVDAPGVHVVEGTLVRPSYVNAEGRISTTLRLTVGESGSNQAPVAVGDSYTTGFGQTLTVEAPGVLGNDTDADGDALTAVLVTPPSHGELELDDDGSFTYAPDAGFTGADTFTYRASDGTADSAAATVTITVGPGEPGALSGVVTAAGSPLEGACVYLYEGEAAPGASFASCAGADGAYHVSGVTAGEYVAAVADPSGAFATLWVEEPVVVTSGETSVLDVTLEGEPSGHLVGEVTAASGPAPGVCVFAYERGASEQASYATCAGASGAYGLYGVASAEYDVAFFDPAGTYLTQWWTGQTGGAPAQDGAAPVAVPTGGGTVTADAVVQEVSSGAVSGVVTSGGTPLGGVCVYLYEGETGPAAYATCTGADGSWWIGDVTPGEYRVAFADHSGAHVTQWWDGSETGSTGYAGSAPVTVTAGTTLEDVDAALVPQP